ncbi:MAG: SpoIIE family protein phosphatase [Ignavibacteriales bacterium]|nr:SpoIIE family protein phosphatase [Ignavibacteriales bacterium]
MKNPFEQLSARSIRVLFSAFVIVVLFISSVNFLDVMIFKATSNDQCGWLPRPDGEPGALITDVAPDGVTDRAGIKDGDILLEINGRSFRTPAQAMSIINPMRGGDTATYLIERNGAQFEAKVEILKLVNVLYLGYCFLGVSFLVVGYVVVMTRPTGKTQRQFAFYALVTMLVFGLSNLGIDPSVDPPWKVITLAVGFGAGRFIAIPVFLMFFLHFPVRRKVLDHLWFKIAIFSFSAIVVVPFFTGWLQLIPPEFRGFFVGLPFLFYLGGLLVFIHSYFRRVEKEKRKQVRPIFVAVLIGIATFVYLIILQGSNPFLIFTKPVVYAPIVLLAGVPVAFGYSIFRYRLMDIDLIVKRSLLYGAITAMIAALYLGMVFGIGSLLGSLIGDNENTLLNVLAFLVIAFAFDPVKQRVQDWIDHLFYRQRLNYQQALLEFSQELPSQMNLDQILHSMVNRISGTMHVDRVAVVLCDEKEGCTSVGRNIPVRCCSFAEDEGGLLDLLKLTRAAQYFGLLAEEPDSIKIHEADKGKILEAGMVLSVPMFLQNRLIGMIVVGPKLSEKAYSREDISLLATVGSQAAIAIENARLHKTEIERQKIEEELALARRIQQGLLPKENPAIDGLDVAGVAIPAQVVGGDYYDFIELGPKKLLVVVADVSGKGMSAALYMSKIQGMVQLAAHMYQSPREMLTHVNRRIYDGIERKSFITMILALFDLERREVTICRAGHNKALMGTNGQLEYLDAQGIGLGLERGPVFENTLKEVHRPLESGGMFFFYTDGLTEAMNEHRVQLGEESVKSLVEQKRTLSAFEIQRSLTTAVEEFVGRAERHDDLTMVVVKVV